MECVGKKGRYAMYEIRGFFYVIKVSKGQASAVIPADLEHFGLNTSTLTNEGIRSVAYGRVKSEASRWFNKLTKKMDRGAS